MENEWKHFSGHRSTQQKGKRKKKWLREVASFANRSRQDQVARGQGIGGSPSIHFFFFSFFLNWLGLDLIAIVKFLVYLDYFGIMFYIFLLHFLIF